MSRAESRETMKARRPWLALLVLCLGTFAILLDTTVVNVALPSVITGLHASLDQALWVVNAYLLALALAFVPEVRTGRRHRLDVTGVVLASAGLVAVCYGVIEGQRYDWGAIGGTITIPEIIIIGVVLLAVFAAWERRHPEPLLPGSLFASQTFTIMAVLSLMVQLALQSMLLATTLNYQSALGFTAVRAGLTSLPLTITMIALAPFAGRLTDRLGGKWLLMTGLVVYAAGILGIAIVASPTATSLTFAPPLAVAGLGMAAIFAPVNTMGMRAAPRALAGAASGVINTGRQLGATIGGAVTGAVLATQLATGLPSRALIAARHLPGPEQRPFTSGFAAAARSGLQVGRAQPAARIPAGLPRAQIPLLEHLAHDVFARAYIAALHDALAVPVAVLIAGAIGCLLLRRGPAPDGGPSGRPAADTTVVARPTPGGPRS